jgi:hypothetical protein
MTITYQQQLALRRGLFLDTTTNQLITFDPVVANTQGLADIDRTELVEISIPIDSEGSNETVNSVFSISPPGESVNILEDGKTVTDIAVWQTVTGAVGSKYIWPRNIQSAEEAPQVGDKVSSFATVVDSMYANNTVIEEINPTMTFTIKDIVIVGGSAEALEVWVLATPDQGDIKFPISGSWANVPIAQKFTFTLASNIDIGLSFLGVIGQAFNSKLKEILGYTNFTPSDHTQCTITNFIKDLFSSDYSIDTYTVNSIPSYVVANGRVGINIGNATIDSPTPEVSGALTFRFYLEKETMLCFAEGADLPENPTIGLAGILWTDVSIEKWNTPNPPGKILFHDSFSLGILPSTITFVPNTGDGSNDDESANPSSTLGSHLLCYKLNNPLVSFTSAGSTFSKSDITRVSFGSTTSTAQTAYVGDSINKDSLLDNWENGYHRAGMILQNKLKK